MGALAGVFKSRPSRPIETVEFARSQRQLALGTRHPADRQIFCGE
jgi:hypothetical protein